MQTEKRFEKTLVVRVGGQDEDDLRLLASRLDLSFSEVARRALRIGAKLLDDVNFPGGARSVEPRRAGGGQ